LSAHLPENLHQRRFADGLAQEFDRARRPATTLLVVTGPPGEEYDRGSHAALGEAALDLEATDARHADIEYDAVGSHGGIGNQELLAGRERLGAIPERPDQAVRRLPNRRIVVDDDHQRRVVGRLRAQALT
jgi:hypothetical protein